MEGQHIFVATNQVRSRNDPKSKVRLYPYGIVVRVRVYSVSVPCSTGLEQDSQVKNVIQLYQ